MPGETHGKRDMMGQDAAGGLPSADDDGLRLAVAVERLRRRWIPVLVASMAVGALTFGATFLMKPVYTATTTIMPPQQSQSGSMAALASLSSSLPGLAGLAGGGLRSTGDHFVALLQSVTVSDRMIDRFKLQDVYDERLKVDTRRALASNARFRLSKKDGLLAIDVDDVDPKRAADMANHYVVELTRITDSLAVTEAQQRRLFFERQLQSARERLNKAQDVLLASGFHPDTLKSEPKAAADLYARRKAEVTMAEVQLQVLRQALTDTAPEVKSQLAALGALRAELSRLEQQTQKSGPGPDYVGAYREFKFRETQFELLVRQLELARLDESREGALIQVVDPAEVPEKRSRPRRSLIALGAALGCALLAVAWAVLVPARRRRAVA